MLIRNTSSLDFSKSANLRWTDRIITRVNEEEKNDDSGISFRLCVRAQTGEQFKNFKKSKNLIFGYEKVWPRTIDSRRSE